MKWVKKLLRDIYQLRKMRMRKIMQKVLGVDQDGKSQRNIEISSPNNSKQKKLKERLLLQLLPPLKKVVKKEVKLRRVRVRLKLKVKKRKKRKRKKLKLLLKVTLSQLTLLLSQSLTSKISIVCKIS